MVTKRNIAFFALVVAALLVPQTIFAAGNATARVTRVSSLEAQVLSSLNATRTARGLAPLRISKGLSSAARQHSDEMLSAGYFAHTSADGSSFDARIARSYPFARTFSRWSVGENLVWEAPDLHAAEATRLWMASPAHRKNILDSSWTEIGIAAVHADAAPGVFGGGEVTLITTDFGTRS